MKLIQHLIFPSVICMSLTGLAQADIYSICQDAIASDDRAVVKRLASTILRFTNVTTGEKRQICLECINQAMDEEYVYDEHCAGFMPKDQSEEFARERKQAQLEQTKQRNQESRDQAKLEAAQAALRKQDQEREEARTKAVWRRVMKACRNLYKTHPDETVTNKICLDIFLVTGLPND